MIFHQSNTFTVCSNKGNVLHSTLPLVFQSKVFVQDWHGHSHKPVNNAQLI